MTTKTTMTAPAGVGGEITGMPSGTVYQVNSSGQVFALQQDVFALTIIGFTQVPVGGSVGTPGGNATTVVAQEYGDAYRHITVLTVTNLPLPAIVGNQSQGVGVVLYTLPTGVESLECTSMSLGIMSSNGNISAQANITVGVGSVVATGNVSVLSGTPTFQDLIIGQTATDGNGTATVKTTVPTGNHSLVTEAAGSKTINFNAAAVWGVGGDTGALVSGSLVLEWSKLR